MLVGLGATEPLDLPLRSAWPSRSPCTFAMMFRWPEVEALSATLHRSTTFLTSVSPRRSTSHSRFELQALRVLGGTVVVFALEALMDEAAEKAGLDAVQFRVAHLSDERAQAVILKAAQMANWGQASRPNEGLGIGFAQYKNKSAYCAVIAKVRVDDAVLVTQVWAAPMRRDNQPCRTSCSGRRRYHPSDQLDVKGGQSNFTATKSRRMVGPATRSLKFSEVPQIDVELLDRPEYPPLGAGRYPR